MSEAIHIPVLLEEVIHYIEPAMRDRIIDATLDGGGHTLAILEKHKNSQVLGIEWDPDEFAEFKAKSIKSEIQNRLITVNDSYVNIPNIARSNTFIPNAILFDLGVSSWHYESSKRGFSFNKNEPLDMRFNPGIQTRTAADIINMDSEEDLERILAEYGEESFSKQIAHGITTARQEKAITDSGKLASVIEDSVPVWYRKKRISCSTKTFQALRIVVNDELGTIRAGLQSAIDILPATGRILVISFHGLEDKIVREVFTERTNASELKWVTKRTIRPKWEEIKRNPRARSAKMKIGEKV